jgi:hypothetical protein
LPGIEDRVNIAPADLGGATLHETPRHKGETVAFTRNLSRVVIAAAFASGIVALGAAPASASIGNADLPEFPIQCLDGTTVEFGQFCPIPALRCADGSSLPLGGTCPAPPKQVASTPVPTPTPAVDPELQKCREAGICTPTP